MLSHRQAFPTPREGGKGDPEGGVYLCSLVLTAAGAGEGGAQRQGDFLSRGSFSA